MKKNLIGLLITLLLSGCAGQTSKFDPEPLPVTYRTPYQEANKSFERSNRPPSMSPAKRGYFA